MTVYEIIQELKSTRSRNTKEDILKREVDNADLKEFFRLALNPFIKFYQKKKFIHTPSLIAASNLGLVMECIDYTIAKRYVTGNAAIEYIQRQLNSLSSNDSKLIMHILQKESGCDLGGATINKIWPKLIPTFPTLLATAFTEALAAKLKWSKGVFSQLKSDGLRINLVVDEEGNVNAYSRAGNELNFFGVFDFIGNHVKGCVIDGELLTVNAEGKFNNRQTSNGICSKAIKGTMSDAESKTLHIAAWDCIPLDDFKNEKSDIEYQSRFGTLGFIIADFGYQTKISLIPSKIVYSLEDAQAHYDEEVAKGEEGTMLKDQDMPWGDTRSKQQLKCKAEHTGDFEVVGFKDGVRSLTGNLGSLVIATSDRKLIANMSGFSLKLRSEIWANLTGKPVEYVMVIDDAAVTFTAKPGDCDIESGSIVEAMYNCKIKARNSDTWSIFLPRYKLTRHDKKEANSIEEIK